MTYPLSQSWRQAELSSGRFVPCSLWVALNVQARKSCRIMSPEALFSLGGLLSKDCTVLRAICSKCQEPELGHREEGPGSPGTVELFPRERLWAQLIGGVKTPPLPWQ